jgi:hypothetical protein
VPAEDGSSHLFGRRAPSLLEAKERRRWPTWSLVMTVFVAAVLGMVIGHIPAHSPSNAAASSSGPAFPGGTSGITAGGPTTSVLSSSHSGTTLLVRTSGEASLPTTTVPLVTSTSTAEPTTTTASTTTTPPKSSTTVPEMHIVVLQTQQVAGPGQTPEFTVAQGPYEVGYAYDCESALTADQSFQILVAPAQGGSSSVFSSTQVQGSGTLVVPTTGDQKLEVETAAACQWVMKVVAP